MPHTNIRGRSKAHVADVLKNLSASFIEGMNEWMKVLITKPDLKVTGSITVSSCYKLLWQLVNKYKCKEMHKLWLNQWNYKKIKKYYKT